ncbi:MAG TPA: GAF domain-containing protein, partial [Chloroflexota bacterium]|nr:GAF domain-containing protein [Chloroflexota bacterium]
MSQELVESESPRLADRSVVNWVLIAAVFLAAIIIDDRAPWPYVMTPLYALPVLIAAWRQRPGEAIITAIVANLINAASGVIQGTPTIIWVLYSSGLIFIGALAVLVSSQRQRVQRRERETADARQQLALQYAVARTLAEAATLHDAQLSLLRVIGEHSGWGPGIFWSVNPAGTALICRAIWYRSGVELPAFDSRSRHTSLPPGVGLPGRIWATGETIWVPDVLEAVNFPRKEAAAAARLHSAFGFPIRANSRVLGVMEFFSSEIRRPDPALLALFKALGSQIGQFVERKRAEEERTDLLAREQAARAEADAERARLETVLHNSASGIIF